MVSRIYLTNFVSHSLSIYIATVKFPRQFNCIKNLRSINIYVLVLHALQCQYPQKQIVSDSGASKIGTMFQSRHVRSYATANIRGIKYGASTHHRGKKCCYAYIHGRAAAQIEYILSVSVPQEDSPALELNLGIIRRFREVQNAPVMPWSLWCVKLPITHGIPSDIIFQGNWSWRWLMAKGEAWRPGGCSTGWCFRTVCFQAHMWTSVQVILGYNFTWYCKFTYFHAILRLVDVGQTTQEPDEVENDD